MQNDETPGSGPSASASSSGSPALDEIARDFVRADLGWEAELARHPKWEYVLASLPNVYKILLNHDAWRGVIAYDQFSGVVVKRRPPPFDAGAEPGEWTDIDDGRLALWLAQRYGIEPKDAVLMRAVMGIADANCFHPVREYLRAVTAEWDQAPRLDLWLRAYLGAVPRYYELYIDATGARGAEFIGDDPRAIAAYEPKYGGKVVDYTAAVGAKFLIGAVARVMRPGCKMDNVLILEGLQYLGKSSALMALAQPWFTDQQIKIGDKDTYETMRGQWVVELPELDAFNRAETTSAKAFFSRAQDRFRTFYGRRAANVLRQCVFAGTVNHYQYFHDSSGNRRYWPVKCTSIDLVELARERDQIWAEAQRRFDAGEPWWVQPDEKPMFDAEAESRYVGDAWEIRILNWLDEDDVSGLRRSEATMDEILGKALHLDASKWTRAEQTRVGQIMERIGWPRVRPERAGERIRVYRRPTSVQPSVQPFA